MGAGSDASCRCGGAGAAGVVKLGDEVGDEPSGLAVGVGAALDVQAHTRSSATKPMTRLVIC